MRIAILASPDSWYYRDLKRAAAGRHEVALCAFEQLEGRLGEVTGPAAGDGTSDLTDFDCLLVRSMPLGSLEQVIFRMDVLARLEQSGCVVLNPPRALEIAIDKYLALARLADAGLLVPPTVTCQTAQAAMTAFENLGGDVVIKPLFGSEGRGITRINDPALAHRAFRMLGQLGAVIYLQKYVPHPGYDLRLLVLGSALFAIRRRNPSDWRTNVSRGGIAEPVEVSHDLQQIARRAARAVGAPFAGVDLLEGRDGKTYVLEVNAVPGWKALARTLRLDMAQHILDYLEQASGMMEG